MKIHDLKSWPEPFEQIFNGLKTADVRNNDRDFRVGEFVNFHEYDHEDNRGFTGRSVLTRITHISKSENMPHEYGFILPANVAVLSLKYLDREKGPK